MNSLQVGKATRVGDKTLIPLFRVKTVCIEQADFFWINGTAEPFAVVIAEPGSVHAIQMDASELSVEMLVEQMPELGAVLKNLGWGNRDPLN